MYFDTENSKQIGGFMVMRKFISILTLVALLAVTSVGCAQKNDFTNSKSNRKLNIVATIYPQDDLTRAIVGDKANLTMVVSPGASVHSFEPSPGDILKIKNADIFIYNGGDADAWVDNILNSMDRSKMKVLHLMDYVKTVEEKTVEGMEPEKAENDSKKKVEEPENDEHIWTSPKNAITLTNAISNCLCERDSVNANFYKNSAKNYIGEIKKGRGRNCFYR